MKNHLALELPSAVVALIAVWILFAGCALSCAAEPDIVLADFETANAPTVDHSVGRERLSVKLESVPGIRFENVGGVMLLWEHRLRPGR